MLVVANLTGVWEVVSHSYTHRIFSFIIVKLLMKQRLVLPKIYEVHDTIRLDNMLTVSCTSIAAESPVWRRREGNSNSKIWWQIAKLHASSLWQFPSTMNRMKKILKKWSVFLSESQRNERILLCRLWHIVSIIYSSSSPIEMFSQTYSISNKNSCEID